MKVAAEGQETQTNSKPQAVTLDDLQIMDGRASLKVRLEVESPDKHPAIGVESDGFFITTPYAAVGLVGSAEPSKDGLTKEEADFIATRTMRPVRYSMNRWARVAPANSSSLTNDTAPATQRA